jgi:hypothetical protein
MPSKFLALTCATVLVGGVTAALIVPGASASDGTWAESFRDSFSRTSAGTWGTPDSGPAYTLTKSSKVSVGTSGSTGWATIPAADGLGVQLPGVQIADVGITDVTTVAAGAGSTYDAIHTWTGRKQSDGSAYAARVRFDGNGKASLAVSRLNGAASTTLASVTLPTMGLSGDKVHGELRITGTAPVVLKARAWVGDGLNPDWQINYSDSAANAITTTGAVAVSDYVNSASAPITVNLDDLVVSTYTEGTAPELPTPTPSASDTPTASASPTATTTPTT